MEVTLDVKVDASAIGANLRALPGRIERALRTGFVRALEHGASAIQAAGASALKSRTGQLLNAVIPQPDAGPGPLAGLVGVPPDSPAERYAYLLTNASKDIRPVNARTLTIPIAANLTGAGVARWPTVASLIEEFGDRVVFGKRVIGVASKSGRGSLRMMFVRSFGVTVRGRDVFEPALRGAGTAMTKMVQAEVDRATR